MKRLKKQVSAIFWFTLLVAALLNLKMAFAQTDNVTNKIAGQASATPRQLITKAEEFYAKGEFEQAGHFLEQSMKLSDPEKDAGDHLDAAMFLSEVYLNLGYHQRALETLTNLVPLIIVSTDRFRNVLFLNSLGDLYLTLGNMELTAKYLLKALEEARLAQNPRILARVLNNIGNALAVDGGFLEALAAYEEGLELIKASPEDAALKANILVNIVRASFLAADYERAAAALEYAQNEIEKQPDSHNKAANMMAVYNSTLTALEYAKKEIEKQSDFHDKATNMIALSQMSMEVRNKLDQSFEEIKTEADLTFTVKPTAVKPTENAYNVLVDIPQGFTLGKHEKYEYNIYFDLGQSRFSESQAEALKNKLTELIQKEETRYIHIRLKGFTDTVGVRKGQKEYKTNLELSKRRIENVNAYLNKFLPNLEQTDKKSGMWIYSLLMGEFKNKNEALIQEAELKKQYQIRTFLETKVFLRTQNYSLYAGEYRSVEEAATQSLKLFKTQYPVEPIYYADTSELKDKSGKLLIYKDAKGSLASSVTDTPHYLGQAEDRKVEVEIVRLSLAPKKKTKPAETASAKQRERFSPNTPLDALKTGILYEKDIHGHLTQMAAQTINTAQEIGGHLQDKPILSLTSGQMGARLENEKHFSKAMQKTRQALFFAEKQDRHSMLYLWQWQMARLFKAQGDMVNAIRYYKKAVKTLKPIHQKLLRGYRSQKNPFNTEVRPVFLELAEIFLDQADTMPNAASRERKLGQAIDTMEILKAFELQNFFIDECVIKETESVVLDRAAPHTAIIYPIVLHDHLAILLILPDSIKQIKVPVDSKTLEQTVTRFRKRLQNRTNNRFLYEARQLYDWVIRPAEDKLAAHHVDTLIIASDGALRLIPFSTFHDGKQFLIEKYALATVPAITLFESEHLEYKGEQILISGLSDAVQGFSALPSVTDELHDIKAIMNGKALLHNAEHTIDNLARELENNTYSIMHLATHGVFGGTPDETFLLTYDNKLTIDRLEKLLDIRKYRKDKVELLVMSACQTALGDERAALGIAGVAVKTGVRSVIATLWFVDDEATSLAIREFYRQLKTENISKAKALQNAQKKLISQARYWHPLYWAPFLLIGNWM